MEQIPWDQHIARRMVRPLAKTPVRPNHITLLTLVLAVFGALLFAPGDPVLANWGAGIFIFARFLDHFDGELARLQGTSSKLGYYLDYVAGGVGYAALYACLGIGLSTTALGSWATVLGFAGAAASVISLFGNLKIDKDAGGDDTGEAVGYPGFAGLELEDGMYLLGPVTWLGFLTEFFVLASLGAVVYGLWTIRSSLRHAS